ncbi:uncharacterized protein LOC127794070 [Diospyros lotus]|uniref:uncharacterized protein LOC127794070 n=1 Tax=Diospyros lotus TaxID=55363 RepID=UPI0022597C42|nr:uncharacterized protein LOC127794070 [Diospyros lotus]
MQWIEREVLNWELSGAGIRGELEQVKKIVDLRMPEALIFLKCRQLTVTTKTLKTFGCSVVGWLHNPKLRSPTSKDGGFSPIQSTRGLYLPQAHNPRSLPSYWLQKTIPFPDPTPSVRQVHFLLARCRVHRRQRRRNRFFRSSPPVARVGRFVDRLKAKGYFAGAPSSPELEADAQGTAGEGFDVNLYTDMNLVKDAALSFARDRFDIFKSLSSEDIQAVVEVGCPNLFRKVVNSAKRLRAYVRLDEGDVCSACNLRGSCDRAYVMLKDSEGAARMVDIVRILLFCALDPLIISGGEISPGRPLVEASARNLLSDLVALSETSLDPELPKPAARTLKQNKSINFVVDEQSIDVEMKRGDWMCPRCNFMNFEKNLKCLKCKENGPKRVGSNDVEMKKGDWICTECNFMNFARNVRCLKCKSEGPKRVVQDVKMKKGDWNCPKCDFMNYASNRVCLRCREARPKRQLNPGEWECPSCNFLNFRRNITCLKCNCERPKEVARQYEEQMWMSPQQSPSTSFYRREDNH